MRASALWAGIAGGFLMAGAGAGLARSAPASSAELPLSAAEATGPTSDAVPLKDFDCGAKDKPCPLQGWMKTVMATASSSGDGAKLGAALDKVAAKPPPGMADWSTMAKDASAKAKKGDIDGAKESCKKCHDSYKDKYKDEMRDRPWS